MSDTTWYFVEGGKQNGPVSEAVLRQLIALGTIRAETMVWREGMAEWQSAGSTPGLLLPNTTGVQGVPPPVAPASAAPATFTATEARRTDSERETMGMLALLTPLVATALIWLWIGQMNLLQNPESSLSLVGFGCVVLTGLLVGLDASKLGIGGPDDLDARGNRRKNGPANWALFTIFLFVIGYPAYMAIRSRYRARNYLVVSILAMVAFFFSWFAMSEGIERKKGEVRGAFENLGRQLNRR